MPRPCEWYIFPGRSDARFYSRNAPDAFLTAGVGFIVSVQCREDTVRSSTLHAAPMQQVSKQLCSVLDCVGRSLCSVVTNAVLGGRRTSHVPLSAAERRVRLSLSEERATRLLVSHTKSDAAYPPPNSLIRTAPCSFCLHRRTSSCRRRRRRGC